MLTWSALDTWCIHTIGLDPCCQYPDKQRREGYSIKPVLCSELPRKRVSCSACYFLCLAPAGPIKSSLLIHSQIFLEHLLYAHTRGWEYTDEHGLERELGRKSNGYNMSWLPAAFQVSPPEENLQNRPRPSCPASTPALLFCTVFVCFCVSTLPSRAEELLITLALWSSLAFGRCSIYVC